jgi:hypothetical protein
MDPTLKIAVVAAGSAMLGGLITGVVAPHVAWGIEKKNQKLAYRRELIDKWRAMLAEAAQQDIGRGKETEKLLAFLEKHKDFYSLSPQLPSDNSYEAYYQRHASLSVPVYLRYLTDEISRIEKEWDLV